MSQAEVIKLLEKNRNKKYSSQEIAEILNKSRSCVSTSIKKLKRQGFIIVDRTNYKKPVYKLI